MENEKLFAEFMELEITGENKTTVMVLKDGFNQQTKYRTSWDWLMPVVEKIENFFEINGKELEFQIVSYEDEVKVIAKHSDKEWEIIVEISADGSGKKENTYKACFEFIKWFNELKY